MAYRVTLPASRLEGIQGLEDLITTPGNIHWIGPKGTILSYLLEGINDMLVNLVFTYVFLPRIGVLRTLILSTAVMLSWVRWKTALTRRVEHPVKSSKLFKVGIQGK